jgi:hypothetical protein
MLMMPWTGRSRSRGIRAHDRLDFAIFEEERQTLLPYRGRFDGFHEAHASVSKTCLVRFDNNRYSVNASAVGRPVEIHAYAGRIVIRQNGRVPSVPMMMRQRPAGSLPLGA